MAQIYGSGYCILPMGKSKSSGDLFVKLLSIIAFILIILALNIIARIPPADGYEISIYEAYPMTFWCFLILSFACGVIILMHQAFVTEKSKWWATGILLVIFTNCIIMLLPIFRGYFISSSADEVSHLGIIKNIYLTYHLGINDVYPISHILSYELSSICELDFRFVIKIIPSIFYLIYIAGLYLLAKIICSSYGQVLLVLAFGSGLLFTYFNYLFLPTQFFLYLVPLVLFLFFRKRNSISIGDATIFAIFLIMLPFLHPLGSVFLVAIFLLLAFSIEIFNVLTKKIGIKKGEASFYSTDMALKPGAIVLITFLAWFLNFAIFRSTFYRAYNWFVWGYGTPEIIKLGEAFDMSGFSILKLANLIIMSYGPSLILSFFSLVAIYIIFHRIFSQRSDLKLYEIFFPLLFLSFCVFYISTLFGDFLGTGRSQRIFCWALVPSIVINGLVFHELIISFRNKFNVKRSNIACVCLIVAIVIAAILGMFSVYPSPRLMQGNVQVTTMDWAGMTWFFDHKNDDRTIYFNQLPWRAPDYLYGEDIADNERKSMHPIEIPQNLGYNKYEFLANSIGSDSYIVINDQVRVPKERLWPYLGKYTIDDLNRVSHDYSVIRVYSNRELDICRVLAFKM